MKQYKKPMINSNEPDSGLPTCLAVGAASAAIAAASVAASKLIGDDRFSKKNTSMMDIKE